MSGSMAGSCASGWVGEQASGHPPQSPGPIELAGYSLGVAGTARVHVPESKEVVTVPTVTKGLFVRIEAKEGHGDEVRSFLDGALALVEQEPDTTAWFAVQFGPSTFAIFDVFPDERGRDAHLSGKVAEALLGSVGTLVEQPNIERIDVIAAKRPA
jgi:quinol monooxygenase YgiN